MATFHYIIACLNDHVIRYQLPFNQFSVPSKLLFLDSELSIKPEADSFLFCDAETFRNCIRRPLPAKSCFFVAAHNDELPPDIPYTCNYIACSLSYPALCTAVIQIYQSYESAGKTLSKTIRDYQGIRHYFNMLSVLTSSGCALYNEKCKMLLSSDGEEAALFQGIPFPDADQLQRSAGIFFLREYNCHLCICQQTFHSHTFYLVFLSLKPFSGSDIQWVAAEALQHILSSMANHDIPFFSKKEQAVSQFISDIMEQKVRNWTETMERYTALAPNPSSFTTFAYILMPDSATAMTRAFFMSELSQLFPDYIAGAYGHDFVMLCQNPEKAPSLELKNAKFNWLLEKYDAYVGLSLYTKYRFRTNIILAQATARFGRELHLEKDNRIFYHNNYSIYYLIDLAAASFSQIHDSKDLTYLMHPAVLKLNGYDRDHNTNLLEVLYHYLLNGCSVNETALALNVHRNTIQAKINKLNELVKDDFTKSGMIQCRLLVSCMIFFYQTEYSRVPFYQKQRMEFSFRNQDNEKA